MGLIREKLDSCPICGESVLGLRCEYKESFAYIQCKTCGFEFAAVQRRMLNGNIYSGKLLSNEKDTARLWNAMPRQNVVYCKDCRYCHPLKDGRGFSCEEWDTDFFSPRYDSATYYCADGRRKTNGDKADPVQQ